jgi:RpiB/LacA/LacB family sugar-phosphate isomerase
MRIFFGSDHAGFELKTRLLDALPHEFSENVFEDCGCNNASPTDYPIYAESTARAVVKENGLGVLICGSGIGMAIAANKVKGVRAASAWDDTSARLAREHNDANIVCLGARLVGFETAMSICRVFFTARFLGGHHASRVELIRKLESIPCH